MKHAVAVAIACALIAGEARSAEPVVRETGVSLARMTMGYSYFNRPGATPEQHDQDVKACLAKAMQTIPAIEVLGAGGILGVAVIQADWRGTVGAGLENCMTVRGWRVVSLPDAEGAALIALEKDALAARLQPWIGAEAPNGAVVRAWANETAAAATPRFEMHPNHTNDGQLGLKAAAGQTLDQLTKPASPTRASVKLDPTFPKKAVQPNQIASVPPGAGVIVVQTKGLSVGKGTGINFVRMGPDEDTPASSVDHRPDSYLFLVGSLFSKKDGNWIAFPAAPGRWRIGALNGISVLSLCLGSPAFEVAAGEVVYAGSFDFSAPALGPNLDLAPAKAFLAGQPAAEAVKPARYVNGVSGKCGDAAIYALEVPGAPFEPGYAYGGALAAASRP